jgi:hypothetical protein
MTRIIPNIGLVVRLDKISFFARFSQEELSAYFAGLAAQSVPLLTLDYMIKLAPYEMELSHPAMVQGRAILIAAEILTEARADEIFS